MDLQRERTCYAWHASLPTTTVIDCCTGHPDDQPLPITTFTYHRSSITDGVWLWLRPSWETRTKHHFSFFFLHNSGFRVPSSVPICVFVLSIHGLEAHAVSVLSLHVIVLDTTSTIYTRQRTRLIETCPTYQVHTTRYWYMIYEVRSIK